MATKTRLRPMPMAKARLKLFGACACAWSCPCACAPPMRGPLRLFAQAGLDRVDQLGGVPRLGEELVQARLAARAVDRLLLRLARQHDLDHGREPVVRLHQELVALHARHQPVGDDHQQLVALAGELVEQLQRLLGALCDLDVEVVAERAPQLVLERGQHDQLVVHAQQHALVLRMRFHRSPPAIGNTTVKVLPLPTSLSTRIRPRCLSTILRTMSRPRPVPSPAGLVVKKASKMRSRTSSGMPQPVSATDTSTSSPSRRMPTV